MFFCGENLTQRLLEACLVNIVYHLVTLREDPRRP